VRALADYLDEPRSAYISYLIDQRLQEEGRYFEADFKNKGKNIWGESVAFFVARRAEGIKAA
jgi:hypothetical protein